ncbi:MAG: DUF1501 domain-containing protein [Planctomycetes bacterium]|nr:DUF1501 domain-containing protein [Planctomycetota bacterium]
MKGCAEWKMLNRRSFIAKTGLGVGAMALADPVLHTVASTYGETKGGTGDLLVLCQLNGGFDVLSFLAPYKNSVYRSKRPVLALTAEDLTPLPDNGDHGINNLFPVFNQLYSEGQVAIVQQVGYPDANGSHFESQEIYEFGVRNLTGTNGVGAKWYERLRKTYFDEPFGVLDTRSVGDPQRYGYPDRTYRQAAQDAFGRLSAGRETTNPKRQAIHDAFNRINVRGAQIREKTEGFESSGELTGEFFRAAQLASAGLGTQVIKLSYGGFDTHGSQDQAMLDLFPKLNDHFAQFVQDMKNMGMWERTCVCFYSEFGRRNEENGSPGTDHGHGGHMILVGPRVNGGLHGQTVSTGDLNEPSLPFYVDFRAVFASCIQDWLGFDAKPVFEVGGETYDTNIGSSLFS